MSSVTPQNEWVTDTMALIIRIEKRRLGPAAKAAFELTEKGNGTIHVPGMVFAETLRLVEKRTIKSSLVDGVNYLQHNPNCKEFPMTLAVVHAAAQIHDIRELHDRLIAGTARLLNLELITNDPIIRASTCVRTVW